MKTNEELSNEYDLIVVGAGAAGMATALFASINGKKVLLVERSKWVGGTSALSAGAMWIPNTHLADGLGDTPEQAANYLRLAVDGGSPESLQSAFLRMGRLAVETLAAQTDVQVRLFPYHPDYLSELLDSTTSGRVLECLPFDGRELGRFFSLVRHPIPEFTVFGGMMVDRNDITQLLNIKHSFKSFAYACRLMLRYASDRLRYPRGTRLVMGNALVGRLLHSLLKRDVTICTETQAERLVVKGDRVCGVVLSRNGEQVLIGARLGVVLAGGGFNDHPTLRSQLIPGQVLYTPRVGSSPSILSSQVLALGGRFGEKRKSAAYWTPVSVRKRNDGTTAVFPHFALDRAKPGTVVVNGMGERYLNESASYHQFGERMLEEAAKDPSGFKTYLIADRLALLKYGVGMVRPGGHGLHAFIRDGYLIEAPSIEVLAQRLGMMPDTLKATVARMNDHAHCGTDLDFMRGTTTYQRNLGDPSVKPNPTLGPIASPPYYAVRLYPGDIGASVGLVTSNNSEVMNGDTPIPGLYAVGNDMQSVVGDAYPGPGINLGPAVVFAYAAAQTASGVNTNKQEA